MAISVSGRMKKEYFTMSYYRGRYTRDHSTIKSFKSSSKEKTPSNNCIDRCKVILLHNNGRMLMLRDVVRIKYIIEKSCRTQRTVQTLSHLIFIYSDRCSSLFDTQFRNAEMLLRKYENGSMNGLRKNHFNRPGIKLKLLERWRIVNTYHQ